jgi:5'(3')-deoxyribonucleotidase
MSTKNIHGMNKNDFQVTLNKETYELLQKVKADLFRDLGFEPTNGQVVRHLISIYFKYE